MKHFAFPKLKLLVTLACFTAAALCGQAPPETAPTAEAPATLSQEMPLPPDMEFQNEFGMRRHRK